MTCEVSDGVTSPERHVARTSCAFCVETTSCLRSAGWTSGSYWKRVRNERDASGETETHARDSAILHVAGEALSVLWRGSSRC